MEKEDIEGYTGYTGFWLENLEGRDHLGNLGLDGRIILNWIINRVEYVYWIHLSQDRVKLWALVIMVMNLWVP
jgi:hypothetical protein